MLSDVVFSVCGADKKTATHVPETEAIHKFLDVFRPMSVPPLQKISIWEAEN